MNNMNEMKPLRQQAEEIAENILKSSKEFRSTIQAELPMTAVLLVAEEGKLKGVLVPVENLPFRNKDQVAAFLKNAAQAMEAMYVIFISEVWMKKANGATEGAALSALAASGSIAGTEGATEAIFMTVDGPDIRIVWVTPVNEDGSLGETEKQDSWESVGRFANLSGRVGED